MWNLIQETKAPMTVVVTGANRGIGRAICELILSRPSNPPLILYATSRKGEDLALPAHKAHTTIYQPLDITKPDSISTLIQQIKTADHAPISVLINNAGVNLDDNFNPDNAKTTLDVNYRGTLQVCQAFLPILASDGRIVNLSSIGSSLKPYSPQLAERIRSISSLDDLDSLMKEYESAVSQGNEDDLGFPKGKSYSVSKAAINSFTGTLAKMNSSVAINCCCPGWVKTDMGSMVGQPSKSPEDGAKIPVNLAFGEIGGVSGRYWANDSISGTEDGKVQEW